MVAALALLQQAGLALPVVAKPDLGCRGVGVKLVRDAAQLKAYLRAFPLGARLVLQRYVDRDERRDRFRRVVHREFEDLRFRFADEAAARERRVCHRRQQGATMLQHQPGRVERNRRVERPHRPELVEAQRRAGHVQRGHALVRLRAPGVDGRQGVGRMGSKRFYVGVRD